MASSSFPGFFKHPFYTSILLLDMVQRVVCQPTQIPLLPVEPEIMSSLQTSDEFVLSKTFGFDINFHSFDDHLTVHESVSPNSFPGGINGGVKLAKGEPSQAHSFIVLVQASSTSLEALDSLLIRNGTFSVNVSSGPFSSPPVAYSITIDIIIFSRPRSLQFGHTTIWATNLPIAIWPDLFFETYHLRLISSRGTITGVDNLNFIAHELNVFTSHGSIIGAWALPASISFTTAHGDINIDLAPRRWSSSPYTAGNLSAFAGAGDITIRMPLDDASLSLRNGTAVIAAPQGSVRGTLVHSAVTSVRAYADVNLTIKPYWAFYQWDRIQQNYLTTDARCGNTTIVVLPPRIDAYFKINPLFFAVSRHTQGMAGLDQKMALTYPGQWGGVATGYSGFGAQVDITGDDFEEVERNSSTVKVQRLPKTSVLYFEADVGTAELRLNPCDRPWCGFPTVRDIVNEK